MLKAEMPIRIPRIKFRFTLQSKEATSSFENCIVPSCSHSSISVIRCVFTRLFLGLLVCFAHAGVDTEALFTDFSETTNDEPEHSIGIAREFLSLFFVILKTC